MKSAAYRAATAVAGIVVFVSAVVVAASVAAAGGTADRPGAVTEPAGSASAVVDGDINVVASAPFPPEFSDFIITYDESASAGLIDLAAGDLVAVPPGQSAILLAFANLTIDEALSFGNGNGVFLAANGDVTSNGAIEGAFELICRADAEGDDLGVLSLLAPVTIVGPAVLEGAEVVIDGNILAESLTINDPFSASGNLTATNGDIVLGGPGNLNRLGIAIPQTVQAVNGGIFALGDLSKTTFGDMVLTSDLVLILSNVGNADGNLIVNGNLQIAGPIDQLVLAGGLNVLDLNGNVARDLDGSLTLVGDAGIELQGDVTTTGTGTITFNGDLLLDGLGIGSQAIATNSGNVTFNGNVTKVTNGSLAVLTGAGLQDYNGDLSHPGPLTLASTNGDLNAITLAGNAASAGGSLTVDGNLLLDGPDQAITTDGGNAAFNGNMTKATNGALAVNTGAGPQDYDGDLAHLGNTVADTLTLTSTNAGPNAIAIAGNTTNLGGSLTVNGNLLLDGDDQALAVDGGNATFNGNVTKATNGSLAVITGAGLQDYNGDLSHPGPLTLASTNGDLNAITLAGNAASAGGSLTVLGNLLLDGGDQLLTTDGGDATFAGDVTKATNGSVAVNTGAGLQDYDGNLAHLGNTLTLTSTNAGPNAIAIAGNAASPGGSLTVNGNLVVDGAGSQSISVFGDAVFAGSVVKSTSGDLALFAGADVVIDDDLFVSDGALTFSADEVLFEGAVTTIQAQTVRFVSGTVEIGAGAVADLAILGDVVLEGTTSLVIDVDSGPGLLESDRVIVNGAVQIQGGALLIPGPAAPLGSVFEIISADTVTGQFGTVDAPPNAYLVYEPNRVLLGFESPTAVGACCLPSGQCWFATFAGCQGYGGTWQGAFTACADVTCPIGTGACCFSNGVCNEVTPALCLAWGGTYQGDGSTCAECPPGPLRACCLSTGDCLEVPPEACILIGGTPQASGVTCAGTECSSSSLGACCFELGVQCVEVAVGPCLAAGGTFQGVGTSCTAVICTTWPTVGACCYAGGVCGFSLEVPCLQAGGAWLGPGTSCVGDPCAP